MIDGMDKPSVIRASRLLANLRQRGQCDAQLVSRVEQLVVAAKCPWHGKLDDPVIGMVDAQAGSYLVVACPWCSGSAVLARWEAEGADPR